MKKNKAQFVKTKKPKEVYKQIMNTKLCDVEQRKSLFDYLKLSVREHYNTIFGKFSNDDIEFVFDEDATILMQVYADGQEYDSPYVFEVWKILTRIPLDRTDEWCFETFLEEMN